MVALFRCCLSQEIIGEYQNIKSEAGKRILVDCFLAVSVVDLIHPKRVSFGYS